MPESFGARLRQRREQQQIALTTIATQTKIKLSLLESLERDDLSHWPAGIFRRAFIRAYAHAIGLEPDVVVREFLELYPDPAEAAASVTGGGAEGAPPSGAPPMRLRYLVGTAIDSLSRLRAGAIQGYNAATQNSASVDGVPAKSVGDPTGSRSAGLKAVEDSPPAGTVPVKPVEDPSRADSASLKIAPSSDPDLWAAAQICTDLGRIDDPHEAAPLLQEAAVLFDAVGLIVWVWDREVDELTPMLAYGYSDRVLAQLPKVKRDADNATAAAFRSAEMCFVYGSDLASDALVVPMMTSTGCLGVLAIELQHGSAQKESVRALVTILAAQLARLVSARPPQAVDRKLA